MKKVSLIAIMALVIGLFSTSCSSDDGDRPTVQVLEPTRNATFQPGDEITVKAILTDEVELSQFKLDIHYAGDGHTHRPSISTKMPELEWDHEVIESISGSTYEVNISVQVPETIMSGGTEHAIKRGDYHLGVFAISSRGFDNRSFVDIKIE